MQDFVGLIVSLLAVALVQIICEFIFDQMGWKPVSKMANIACVLFCYALLFRFVYNNFLGELMAFVNNL